MIRNIQELIKQIKEQIPINEFIAEYLSVKKSGRNYVALCPFHNDSNPSLHINPEKGIFKCFSCGTGGDLIYFYSQYQKKNFGEAIEDISTKYGFKVEYGKANNVETQLKTQLYELNRVTLDFFKSKLLASTGTDTIDYLTNKRSLKKETIEKFDLGLAENSWDSLFNYLSFEKKYPQELIIASGLFIPRENGNGYYDRFRNRVIFPILSENNNVIGFGGRILTSDEPKYLNSPETLVFNKGSILYGFNFAKDEIKKDDSVILTEGYLDVISAHQAGLTNTVATLGTALTPNQAKLLGKYTESKKVYLCMDSDKAGKKSVENIFRLLNSPGSNITLDVRVLSDLGGVKDLDEAVKTLELAELKNKISTSQNLIYFILDRAETEYLSTQSEILRKTILDQTISILSEIKDPIEKRHCTKYLCHKLNIEEELLNLRLRDKSRSNKSKQSKEKEVSLEDGLIMHTTERFKHAEIELLTLYLSSFPDNVQEIKTALATLDFLDEKHKLIKDYIDSISIENITPNEVISKLMLEFNEYKHLMNTVSELAWKIESDLLSSYSKNKDKILKEAKEWIEWWINNKQKLKSLTEMLKDCKDNKEGEKDILLQIMQVVKNTNLRANT